jgi:putative nucleotidyltransferase with HDIG domain
MRHPLARDVLFADLMLWDWLRRLWVEHRLARAQSAVGAGDLTPHARADALRDLARLLEARDSYTHGHSKRVARHALRIAKALHVPAAEAERIWTAATLHDVGKLYTPREILNKPGRLTDDEFDVIKRHPVDGADMLADIEGDPELVAIVRSHHERLDGNGYPDGLAGSEIPLGARIIAVADTFDALTSTRSYRSAATHKRALDILRTEAGTQLDGAAVRAFLRTYSGRRPAALSALVALAPQRLGAWLGHEATVVASLTPAAGWIAPAAAAAAAVFGFSSPAADRPAPQRAGGATPIAAVRSAGPARIVAVAPASRPARTNREPASVGVKARRPAPKRHESAPSPSAGPMPAPGAGTPPSEHADAASATTADGSTPSEGGAAASPDLAAVPSVRDIVSAAKVPSPPPLAVPVVHGAVATASGTVAAVSDALATTVDGQVANVATVVTTILNP